MFTPSTIQGNENGGTPATNTRSRRRQRPVNSESPQQQPKAKRPRIPLTELTFVDLDAEDGSYDIRNARARVELKRDASEIPSEHMQELSIHAQKPRTGDRMNKSDGTTVLTSNDGYVVSKLPALPDQLRLDATSEIFPADLSFAAPATVVGPGPALVNLHTVARQNGTVDTSSGYALSLTRTHAVVWPYTVASQSPESFVFSLPHSPKHATDPLPLGSLVAPSISTAEPGLMVVMPASGKVTYWESISSATTLEYMRQQRNGVEDSIPGLHAGETVDQIVNAETAAAFVLALSSGRVAHMSVRDTQGRPRIAVQFLYSGPGPCSGGGLFGSFRNVLSQPTVQADIAAVRADRSLRLGERTVVAATTKGKLHAWRIHRGGHYDVLAEYDAKERIVAAVRRRDPTAATLPHDSFSFIDVTFVPATDGNGPYGRLSQLRDLEDSDEFMHLLFLVSFGAGSVCRYVVVEAILPRAASADKPIEIGTIRPIVCYAAAPDTHALVKPRLYLPRPFAVVFIIFARAAVIASIAKPPESPDSQLLADNDMLPTTYEDVIDLRDDPTIEIMGSGIEELPAPGQPPETHRSHRYRAKNPSAVLLVRGAGTIRIATTGSAQFASEKPPAVTAKSKLEQAVFYGLEEDNPLAFNVARSPPFSDREASAAALELSLEILVSKGSHFGTLAPHLDGNLRTRSRALEMLVSHLRSMKVVLDRSTRWRLLWNAEKLHAARAVWRTHQEALSSRPADAKKDIHAEIIEYIRRDAKTEADPSRGEVDELRHWFVHDIDNMHQYVAWACEVIKHSFLACPQNGAVTLLITEALEINHAAFEAAMDFRKRNLAMYGLADEKMIHGVIAEDCAGLEMPWTCDKQMMSSLRRLVELVSGWYSQSHDADEPERARTSRTWALLPVTTDHYLTAVHEYSVWALASPDEKTKADGRDFKNIYETHSHVKVVLLAESHNWEAAVEIAEKHAALGALAQTLIKETSEYGQQLQVGALDPDQRAMLERKLQRKDRQIRDNLDKYGERFAFPFYESLISECGIDHFFEWTDGKLYKTEFLRTKPELAKLSWINDIIAKDDTAHAADTLVNLGLVRERQTWNKRVQLSLGKLARLAAAAQISGKATAGAQGYVPGQGAADAALAAALIKIDNELGITKIQADLYKYLRPIIGLAVDASAALAMVLEEYPLRIPKKHRILHDLFENALSRLLKHEALEAWTLIDLLTLLPLPRQGKDRLAGNPTHLALEVANLGLDAYECSQAEQLIWRRCYILDDWPLINNTKDRGDEDAMDVLGSTELFFSMCSIATRRLEDKIDNPFDFLLPSDVQGVFTENLDRRFENMEKSYRQKMLAAMKWEDDILDEYITKYRLEHWAADCTDRARTALAQEVDRKTSESAPASSSRSDVQSSGSPDEVRERWSCV